MGLSNHDVRKLERAETTGTAQLFSLQRAAEAMNCTLVYALVPNEPLEAFFDRQARAVASEHMKPVEQTMALEGQSVSREASEWILEAYIRTKLPLNLVWDSEDDLGQQLMPRKLTGTERRSVPAKLDEPVGSARRRTRSKPKASLKQRRADVRARAAALQGSDVAGERWLNAPAIGLNGAVPSDLLRSREGIDRVEELLMRLEYGVYC
jgi:hypothetical protein